LDLYAAIKVLSISAIPFLELRVGIPLGIMDGLKPGVAIGLGIAGNLVQVPMILGIMYMLRRLAQQSRWASRWLERIDRKVEKHQSVVRKYGWLGLAIFVGIPIPGTGLWSGAALASLMRVPLAFSLIALGLGVAVSGLLVGAVSTGAIQMIRLF